ncbi:MAG: hypothetical protein ABFR82_05675, partial [Nitrospirota bacterium]
MKPDEIINKGLSGRLLLLVLGVFIVFTLLSAAYIYLDMYRPLSTHYSAVVSIISGIHETLAVKLPAYKAGHQKNSFINDHAVCIPLFGKEGLG